MRRSIALVAASATAVSTVLGALALLAPAEASEQARAGPSACRGMEQLTVPGAERLEAACLSDLTTTGTIITGHTDPSDFTGFGGLSVPGTGNPSGVPGIQLDGYFPDTSTFNTAHGWNHDAQFVIRMPRHWNGGLLVAGPPGIRRQYASDVIISDWVLAQGYAYASTDKGNSGPMLYHDGEKPSDAIAAWHSRVTELTIAAKDVLAQRNHREPRRTYIAGFSAAGRGQRVTHGASGAPGRGLPERLRAEPIWEYSNRAFWDPFQRILREELDPTYDGDTLAGHPFCAPGTPDCDADYVLESRPSEIKDAIEKVSLTGRIGKPLL